MNSRNSLALAPKTADVERLHSIEDRMGRLASLLTEVAEALAEYPDGLKLIGANGLTLQPETRRDSIRVLAREWPSITDIEDTIAAWYAAQRRVRGGKEADNA